MEATAPQTEQTRTAKRSYWLFLVVGVFAFGIVFWLQPSELTSRVINGQNDFVQLYVGAKLVGSPDLYSVGAMERIQREVTSMQSGEIPCFVRLPFYAFFLRPLAWMPYRAAYLLFELINMLCFAWFLWRFVPECRALAAYASLSVPVYAMILNGQDTGILLALASLSIILARKKLDFQAGVVLALCAIKFHLFFLMPFVLILQRRWRVLSGALAAGAALLAISFGAGGWNWPRAFWLAIHGPAKPNAYMPNLHTLSVFLPPSADLPVQIFLNASVALVTIYLAWRVRDYELAFVFGIVGSLLLSVHSYTQDCTLLLLVLVIILGKAVSKPVRWLTEIAVTPVVYCFVLTGVPFNAVMPALLIAILVLAARSVTRISVLTTAYPGVSPPVRL